MTSPLLSTFPKVIEPFQELPDSHSGLGFAYGPGRVRDDETATDVAAATVTLADATTNYIEVTAAGVVSANTVGFTAGRIPLYTVVTAGGAIDTVTDKRTFLLPQGATDHGALTGLADDDHTQYAKKAGDTFTGPVVLSDQLLTRADLKDYSEAVNPVGTVTTSLAIDYTSGQVVTATLGGNATVSITNPPATGGSLTIVLTQDATGSRLVTWPGTVTWIVPGGTAPTLQTAAGAVDVVTLITTDGGTSWLGFSARGA